ncbi:MAG: FtsX-like permease family protein [Planctomycetota bacterium]|nr:FtsX-like permease family protein [Planctomycetota bacterium]
MTRTRLILRNLVYFRAANLAVIAGMAVATAVLTGALLVGDSVRGSLRTLALQRLGPIDHVLVSRQFVPEDLAQRIATDHQFIKRFQSCTPGISLRGGASNESATARTASVQITAVGNSPWLKLSPGQSIINSDLASALALGDQPSTILFSVPTADDTPRDAALARRSRTDVTSGLRVQLQHIAREPGVLSRFTLTGTQRPPLNAWVYLKDLQDAIAQEGRINLLLVQARNMDIGPDAATALNSILHDVTRLEDFGLQLLKSPDGSEVVLNSRSTYIAPAVEQAATAAAGLTIPLRRVLVYLVNTVEKTRMEKTGTGAGFAGPYPTATATAPSSRLHYCIVAGIDNLDGQPLADNEIALNAWTAQHLDAKPGDQIHFNYYQRQSTGQMTEIPAPLNFRVARILPMSGLGADPTLTPAYKGFTDAETIGNWNPPEGIDIDKKLITADDEAYWNKHKAAPKLFISLHTARKLWGNAFGDLTSIRLPAANADDFAESFRDQLDPASLGLFFMPIKAQQLHAASGSTDFAGLFIGFSFFLIIAAALLVAMLFRLAIEQRARQFGLLTALGFSPSSLLRLSFMEGTILALIGAAIGSVLALAYTNLMIAGLRTWWRDAVGITTLQSYVQPMTILMGFIASTIIALLAVYWAVRRIARSTAVRLLSGAWSTAPPAASSPDRPQRLFVASTAARLTIIALLGAIVLLILGLLKPAFAQTAFLTAGTLLLVSALLFTSTRLRITSRAHPSQSLTLLAVRNTARHRTRSIAAIALVAFATFTLVTVASMVQSPPSNTHAKDSGTGGYQLILTADVPLLGDLNTQKGREMLGIRNTDSPLFARAHFTSIRTWAGQDASCLNLTRPTAPTILAVPQSMIESQPFTSKTNNPWPLLTKTGTGTVFSTPSVSGSSATPLSTPVPVPIIADSETANYILKLGLGDTLPITDQLGRPQTLLLAATLPHSIFQSELLMSEDNFLRLFPTQSGYGTVLVECPDADIPELQPLLSTELDDFAVTVEPTTQRLARYQQVANTYLSTFQALGSLGLMLGTVGLAVVLLRNLIERRAELALLSALGFRPAARLGLVLSENAFLLILGLLIGSLAALIAVLPARRAVNFRQLSLTLGLTLLLGLFVLSIATLLATRRITAADLRAE